MFIRTLKDIETTPNFVEWGSGTSHRLLTQEDNIGFTICHTVVWPKTESMLEYRNHLEACYCIEGEGEIEDFEGNRHTIKPGTVYVLNEHDKHILRNKGDMPCILVSVFTPPLVGNEKHSINQDVASSY
ncbi:ectoine synthase [Marinomonas sp. TI.3.20]|uniref:ectoine synthase n=1 Tax=Marinomonas sp. TI.3.20 TaxID=3121296 RepID=UPI00311E3A0B